MSRPAWMDTGDACIQRVDHGQDTPKTFAECREAVDHPLSGKSKAQMADVIAYLSAQIVGLRRSEDAEAKDAMTRVLLIADDYKRRAGL